MPAQQSPQNTKGTYNLASDHGSVGAYDGYCALTSRNSNTAGDQASHNPVTESSPITGSQEFHDTGDQVASSTSVQGFHSINTLDICDIQTSHQSRKSHYTRFSQNVLGFQDSNTTHGIQGATQDAEDPRAIFFFDIDNCLYSREKKIHDLMKELINEFFMKHLLLTREDAIMLNQRYYYEYGLAIEGLTRFHKIDALEFNQAVDDALPLDDVLKPDPGLRHLLESFDKSKVKLWLFTNAYITHGMRVVKLLGIEDLFEGITYCDYGASKLVCKPEIAMFEKAEKEARVKDRSKCYFIDDSHLNCQRAQALGWNTVHFLEASLPDPDVPASKYKVTSLHQLHTLFPHLFKTAASEES
ncbi:hypothetical protein FQN57_006043 [Myotisia sp. PD_48]|nr:hypothetical protein FQN57_006043 [Myotisia sp. PD_48]